MVKKVVVTVGKFKDYSYVLGFTPYTLHKNVMVHLLPSFVFMMGRYM